MTGVDEAIRQRVDPVGVLPVWLENKWQLKASVDARPLLQDGRASMNRPMGDSLAVEPCPYFCTRLRRWMLGTRKLIEELIERGQASLEPLPDTSDFAAHAKHVTQSLQRG